MMDCVSLIESTKSAMDLHCVTPDVNLFRGERVSGGNLRTQKSKTGLIKHQDGDRERDRETCCYHTKKSFYFFVHGKVLKSSRRIRKEKLRVNFTHSSGWLMEMRNSKQFTHFLSHPSLDSHGIDRESSWVDFVPHRSDEIRDRGPGPLWGFLVPDYNSLLDSRYMSIDDSELVLDRKLLNLKNISAGEMKNLMTLRHANTIFLHSWLRTKHRKHRTTTDTLDIGIELSVRRKRKIFSSFENKNCSTILRGRPQIMSHKVWWV